MKVQITASKQHTHLWSVIPGHRQINMRICQICHEVGWLV